MMGSPLKTRVSPYLLVILVALPHLLVCSAAPASEKEESKSPVKSAPSSSVESPKKEDAQILAISKRQTYANPISSVSGGGRDLNRNSYPSNQVVSSSYGFQYSGPPSTLPLSNYPSSGGLGSYNSINDNYRGGGGGVGGVGYVGTVPRNERDYYPSSSSYSGPSYSSGGGGIGGGSSIGRNNYYHNDRLDRFSYDDYRYNNGGGYQRDRDAQGSVNQEYLVRHGQMRHEEYQKRTGGGGPDVYDPFYFIGMRNGGPNGINGNQPERNSIDRHNSILDRPSGFSPSIPPTSPLGTATNVASSPVGGSGGSSSSGSNGGGASTVGTSPAAPLRNRRNSHNQRAGDFYNNEINNGDKYDIMTGKSAYPPSGPHHNHHHHFSGSNNNNHRLANYHHQHQMAGSNSNQFLTREQLLRNPDMRVPYQSNHVDQYSSSSPGGPGLPWSVRIGTQLKVNDDGRSPNPNRFYVRDETNPQKSRSRYPIYRRK